MYWCWLVGLAALVLQPSNGFAQNARLDIGVLTCSLGESGEGDNPGEAPSRKMLCAFRPGNSGPEETYIGDFQRFGQGHGAMIWIVTATAVAERIPPGLLQQVYGADPLAAPGHAPPLVGETNSSIVLQPMADTRARAGNDNGQDDSMIIGVLLRLLSSPA
jgi:hypothetical protein